jgi:FkbM family methyltransferase
MYSQNKEEEFIDRYFGDKLKDIAVLDIGANDGITYSNSRKAIELGAEAILVEPCPDQFIKLIDLYKNNPKVSCFECAISNLTNVSQFFETSDNGLASSLIESEAQKWSFMGIQYKVINVKTYSFLDFLKLCNRDKFDLISIDTEGYDFEILNQINFNAIDCKMLIIEYNGKNQTEYYELMRSFKFHLLHRNAENLIFKK